MWPDLSFDSEKKIISKKQDLIITVTLAVNSFWQEYIFTFAHITRYRTKKGFGDQLTKRCESVFSIEGIIRDDDV